MRAKLSRKTLQYLVKHPPQFIKRVQLQILLNITASAFSVRKKQIWQFSYGRAVREYAQFTEECMNVNQHVNPQSLYYAAYRTGRRIRRITGLTDSEDLERLVFYLYQNIRTVMHGRIPGEFTVEYCYFSRFYTPQQCRVMSYMDEGMIAGICGNGNLEFTERITEGCERCQACFIKGEKQ